MAREWLTSPFLLNRERDPQEAQWMLVSANPASHIDLELGFLEKLGITSLKARRLQRAHDIYRWGTSAQRQGPGRIPMATITHKHPDHLYRHYHRQ